MVQSAFSHVWMRAFSVALATSVLCVGSCATSNTDSSGFGGGSGGGGSSGAGSSGAGSSGGGSSGGPILLGDDESGALVEGGQTPACSDAGCTCIRIASIGHEGIYGDCGSILQDNTSALTTWLSTQSSASIDVYDQSKPTLTADFLSQYNVIIIQWLRDVSDAGNNGALWQFTQDEVNALAAWVHAGGGLITLSGYDSDGNEVVPVNTLLSFASMQYNQDRTEGSDYSSCIHAPGVTGWTPTSPIAAHVTEIGVDGGRSISIADAGAAVAIDCTLTDGSICGAHEDIGSGHVFAFTDEWATYTSQWATSFSCQDSGCAGMTAADKYQVPQFWYNVIQYASSAATCFTIHNPIIIPR